MTLGKVDDHSVIGSTGEDGTVRIWDVSTPAMIVLTGHAGPVNAVAPGRLGTQAVIISAGDDETVRIWDAGNGTQRQIIDLLAPSKAVACSEPIDNGFVAAVGSAICAFDG